MRVQFAGEREIRQNLASAFSAACQREAKVGEEKFREEGAVRAYILAALDDDAFDSFFADWQNEVQEPLGPPRFKDKETLATWCGSYGQRLLDFEGALAAFSYFSEHLVNTFSLRFTPEQRDNPVRAMRQMLDAISPAPGTRLILVPKP